MKKQTIFILTMLTCCILFSATTSPATSRQSTDRSTERETRTQSDAEPATAMPKSEIQTIPKVPDRTVTAPLKKVDKLKSLKVQRAYVKNDSLHVVLQYLGREKLSPQDLIHSQLIVRQGDQVDVVFLRSKMTQLQNLLTPRHSVDLDTGIQPENGLVKVRIKGQRDTYTTKIVITNTGPLEVPKKQVTGGTTPLAVPTKEAAVEDTGAAMAHAKLWDVSLNKIVVYKRGWKEGTTFSYYDIWNKYGGSGNAPKSIIYKPSTGLNYVIPFSVSKIEHSAALMWFKVKPCIQFKSSVTKDKFTLADYKKWNEPIIITCSLRLKGLPGPDIYKESTFGSAYLSMAYYDIFKESTVVMTTGGDGEQEICMEAEGSFSYGEFESYIPARSTEKLYVEVEVELDITDALDEPDEANNITREPVLAFGHSRPDLSLPSYQIDMVRPDGPAEQNKWFIGATKTIQWEEYNNDGMIKIDLYRKNSGVSQLIGTISKHIEPASQKAESFSENYNWHDWQAGHVVHGVEEKVAEPNDPTDPHDFYWLKFYGLDATNHWRPLLMKENTKFTLHNFTKKFGHTIPIRNRQSLCMCSLLNALFLNICFVTLWDRTT